MADTVTSQTIQDGERLAILKFTNESDGTGESSVKKVDVSALKSDSKVELVLLFLYQEYIGPVEAWALTLSLTQQPMY